MKKILPYLIITTCLLLCFTFLTRGAGELEPLFGGTGIGSYGRGDLIMATSSSQLYRLATSTEGDVLMITGGIPAWATGWVTTSLQLDQTVPQTIVNGIPLYEVGHLDFSNPHELVDKEYVDSSVANLGASYYAVNDDSGVSDGVGTYFLTSLTATSSAEVSTTTAQLGVGDTYIAGWISPVGQAPTKLIAGTYNFRLVTERTVGSKTAQIYWNLVEYTTSTVEIIIATSSYSLAIDAKGTSNPYLVVAEDYTPETGSRIIGRVYAHISGTGADSAIALYWQGTSQSHWEIPTNLEVLTEQFVPYTGATADLDLGIYDLTIGGTSTFTGTSTFDGYVDLGGGAYIDTVGNIVADSNQGGFSFSDAPTVLGFADYSGGGDSMYLYASSTIPIVFYAEETGREASLGITNLTGDRAYQFPDLSGTILMATGTQDINTSGELTVTGTSTFNTVGASTQEDFLFYPGIGGSYGSFSVQGPDTGGSASYLTVYPPGSTTAYIALEWGKGADYGQLISYGGGLRLNIPSGENFFPSGNNDVDLGASGNAWKDFYAIGSSTLGTIIAGTWQGTAIDDAYIPDTITITDNATTGYVGFTWASSSFAWATSNTAILTASSSNWEATYGIVNASSSNWDTAYSWGDWSGEGFIDNTVATLSSLTSIGTIGTGVWQGTPIANAYVAGLDQNLLVASSPTFAGLTLSGITSGFLTVDASGVFSTSTIDIGDNTNLAAGRSLTLSGDSIELDAEIYTRTFSIAIRNATTTKNPSAQRWNIQAMTIVEIGCNTDSGSTTIQFDERAEATPNTAGTDVMSAVLVCDNNSASTTAFANSGMAARSWLSLDFDAISNSTNTNVYIKYTDDD